MSLKPLGIACVGLVGTGRGSVKVTKVEDGDSIIEIRRVRPMWLQLNQIWKDNEDEENVIFVHQGQIENLVKALKEGFT